MKTHLTAACDVLKQQQNCVWCTCTRHSTSYASCAGATVRIFYEAHQLSLRPQLYLVQPVVPHPKHYFEKNEAQPDEQSLDLLYVMLCSRYSTVQQSNERYC